MKVIFRQQKSNDNISAPTVLISRSIRGLTSGTGSLMAIKSRLSSVLIASTLASIDKNSIAT